MSKTSVVNNFVGEVSIVEVLQLVNQLQLLRWMFRVCHVTLAS